MVNPAYLREIAPEVNDAPDATLSFFIEVASFRNSESVWGVKYNYAVALDALHEYTMSRKSGSGGQVTSERVGDMQVSYGQFNSSKDVSNTYDLTSYGQMYLNLRKTLVITPIVV